VDAAQADAAQADAASQTSAGAPSSDASETAPLADSLRPGDTIKWVKLEAATAKALTREDDELFGALLEQLVDRWEISSTYPLNSLRDLIQMLPEGTPLTVAATRVEEGREKVISTSVMVSQDSLMAYDRGLFFSQRQEMQRATSIPQALSLGLREGYRRFTDVIRFLKMIPQGHIKLRHVGGPLAIVDLAKNETEKGIASQLMFLTMLSMNLAILNFLPIPALDGGHMMFLIYELVAGKRANEQLEFRLTVAGLLTLLTLMVVVFANDIIRYL
jgi:regulator of sigma E protease